MMLSWSSVHVSWRIIVGVAASSESAVVIEQERPSIEELSDD